MPGLWFSVLQLSSAEMSEPLFALWSRICQVIVSSDLLVDPIPQAFRHLVVEGRLRCGVQVCYMNVRLLYCLRLFNSAVENTNEM